MRHKSGLQNRLAPVSIRMTFRFGEQRDTDENQSERRIRHIERLLEQQRQINAELDKIDDQTRREVEDGLRHERAVSDMIAQSEPTTPPEYNESLPSTCQHHLNASVQISIRLTSCM